MKKNCRTKEQMHPLIEGFASSGLTVKAYANSIGVKFYTYKYWLRKYRLEQQVEESETSSPILIPLKINTTHQQEEHDLNIVYPNGVQINLVNSIRYFRYCHFKETIFMLGLGINHRFHLYHKPTDMRKSFNGLCRLVEKDLLSSPTD